MKVVFTPQKPLQHMNTVAGALSHSEPSKYLKVDVDVTLIKS